MLSSHDHRSLQIAKVPRVWVEGDALRGDIAFPPPGISQRSDEAYNLIATGFLSTGSVGFDVHDWRLNERGGRDYTSQTLMEFSIVGIPANPRARLDEAKFRS